MNVLEVRGLAKRFGGVLAVAGVDLEVAEGELLGLFGPNGAGKTTLFNLIGGALPADGGSVVFRGREVTKLPPFRRAQRGIARTFQVVKPLRDLTVIDNVLVPLAHQALRGLLPLGRYRHPARVARAKALLALLKLEDQALTPAGALPLGTQKRLEVARAMALEPRLLLLDEPLAGLTLAEAEALLAVVQQLRKRTSIVLVEHNVRLAMAACSRAVVMDAGKVIASGSPEVVRRDPEVIRAYLGDEDA